MQRILNILMIIIFTILLATGCDGGGEADEPESGERQRAIDAAMAVYAAEAAAGTDFSDGPCIAEELEDVPGWSVDIAHDPREEVDDEAGNQCEAYRNRRTTHFVELDPEGNLIRAE